MSKEELIKKISDLAKAHEDKKLEIKNLTFLTDKKIVELVEIEETYVELVVELNKLNQENVVR